MKRERKIELISLMHKNFKEAKLLVVTHYQGLSVSDITSLRSRARVIGASFMITKNTLAKRALIGTSFEELSLMFVGPTAVAYSKDPIVAAKAVFEFSQNNEKLKLIAGHMGDCLLDSSSVKELANLPGLDELRSRLIAILQAPMSKVIGMLLAPGAQIGRVLSAYANK